MNEIGNVLGELSGAEFVTSFLLSMRVKKDFWRPSKYKRHLNHLDDH